MRCRKVICVILSIILIIGTTSVNVNALNLSREGKISYLVEKGIPYNTLMEMPDEVVDIWFNKVYGQEIVYLGESSSTLIEQNESSTIPYGTISSSDMTFTVTAVGLVTNLSDGRQKLDAVLLSVDYLWAEGKPLICYEDAISVNWDSSLFAYDADSFSAFEYYRDSGSWVYIGKNSTPTEINQGGLGYYTNLTAGHTQLKGYSTFTLLPSEDNMYMTSANRVTSINAQYVHTKTLGIAGATFGYNGNGITINAPALSDSAAASDNFSYSIG